MTKVKTYNSNQIGGNTVVIETEKSKIAIDFGENLPGSKEKNIEIEGLSTGKPAFDAVFFTHYHGDHIGRMREIFPEIPLYMGSVAKKVLININNALRNDEMIEFLNDTDRIRELYMNTPVSINDGDIVVTPYIVDHSAYEAFMLLIETKDKKIVHTGDFRGHGYRGETKLIPMIHYYILDKGQRKINTLITEGTMLSRMDEEVFTEAQLKQKATRFFENHRHVFLLCSSTNLDSLASFYHAGMEYGMHMYGNPYIISQLRTFTEEAGKYTSLYQFNKVHEVYGFDNQKTLKSKNFEGTQEDIMRKFGFVCLVNANEKYGNWIEHFMDLDPKPALIYSMWSGYRDPKRKNAYDKKLDDFCKKYNAVTMHTSGHADAALIAKVIDLINPTDEIIPIHTERPEMIKNLNISDRLKNKISYEPCIV